MLHVSMTQVWGHRLKQATPAPITPYTCKHRCRNLAIIILMSEFSRSELGEDLEIVMLEMTGEEQEERIRIRHEGSQDAVDLMKVGWEMCC